MKVFTDPEKLRKWALSRRAAGKKIGLVPTMGYLHEGHLSLVKMAKEKGADDVVVSVFVNPIQFGPKEDLAKYPRSEKADIEKCKKAKVAAVFCPSPDDMYCKDHSIYTTETELSKVLCGQRRPGHFRGVCTVLCKLFNIVGPDFAVFGQKDFQQAVIVKRMVRDMNYGIDIFVAPIVRDASGLALSSRNAYLPKSSYNDALALYKALCLAKEEVKRDVSVKWAPFRVTLIRLLRASHLNVDYVEAVDPETLRPVEKLRKGVQVLIAAYCSGTRLIDNMLM